MIGYKLMRLRKDGTLGPLFISARQRVPVNEWLEAEDVPTKGYAHRPGWHIMGTPHAPHLSTKGRVWVRVSFDDYQTYDRPKVQGGMWYLANKMKVLEIMGENNGN